MTDRTHPDSCRITTSGDVINDLHDTIDRREAVIKLLEQDSADAHARITELESQLAQRFDAADMATAAAQGFRDGVASVSAGSEPVAFKSRMTVAELSIELDAGFAAQNYCRAKWGAARGHSEWRRYYDAFVAGYLAAPHPSPPEGMGAAKEQQAGWVSVTDERKPEPGCVVILWVYAERHGEDDDGNPFVMPASGVHTGEWRVTEHGSYFDCHSTPFADVEAVTHWMLPPPPSSTQREAGNGL